MNRILLLLVVISAASITDAKELKLKPVSKLSCKELGKESIWLATECKGLPQEVDKNYCGPGKRMEQVEKAYERKRCG